MKVILKDTKEVKDVSFGYAVNYLLPQGLAELATEEKIKLLEEEKQARLNKISAKTAEDRAIAQKLEGKKVKITAKTGKNKKLFGSITKHNITQALELDPKRVEVILEKSIKKLGKQEVELKVGEARVKVIVEVVKE